jgi:hypothetical protein
LVNLTKGVYRDVDTFVGIAKLERWDEGTTLNQYRLADACGMTYSRLKIVLQAIKENPEWGISVHTTLRGDLVGQYSSTDYSLMVVTFDGAELGDREADVVRSVGNDTLVASVMRLVRGASAMGVGWKRVDKRRQSAKDMKPYVARTRNYLMSMREAAVGDEDAIGIKKQVEQVLALYGVRYDEDDE